VQSQLQVESDSAMVDVLNGFILAELQPDNQPVEKLVIYFRSGRITPQQRPSYDGGKKG
jgi:hypothetical protein